MRVVRFKFSDGSSWDVPVEVIAKNRADVYKDEFGNVLERSLNEDTNPLFEDNFEVIDWVSNNMDWSDVSKHAVKVKEPKEADYEEEFTNCKKKVLSIARS